MVMRIHSYYFPNSGNQLVLLINTHCVFETLTEYSSIIYAIICVRGLTYDVKHLCKEYCFIKHGCNM
jgi:hypothetical protein